jgi:hypothetical protein
MPGILFSAVAAGQDLPTAQPSLNSLNQSAGIIFSGTVTQIEKVDAQDATPAIVRVQFRVDQAVRGCKAGEAVILDEWAELWIRSDRYRKGQKVVIFLYPPSGAGFSSPVAGDVGAIHIGADGLLRTTPEQTRLFDSPINSRSGLQADNSNSTIRAQVTRRNSREPLKVASTEEAAE